jgi:hypothetical protein
VEKYEVSGISFFIAELRPNMPLSAISTAKLCLLIAMFAVSVILAA